MESCQMVYNQLKEFNILYDIVEHPPATTTDQADAYIEGKEGVRTKTLFLCNRKKTSYFLVIMDDMKRLDMKKLGELIGEKGIQFVSEERLFKKLGVKPGSVSIFGLLNNPEKDVKVYFDHEILAEKKMTFHPNDNTKTLFISTEDICKFIKKIGYDYSVIEL